MSKRKLTRRQAWRIEKKYSRYRSDGIVQYINSHPNEKINLDDETSKLIDFAFENIKTQYTHNRIID